MFGLADGDHDGLMKKDEFKKFYQNQTYFEGFWAATNKLTPSIDGISYDEYFKADYMMSSLIYYAIH